MAARLPNHRADVPRPFASLVLGPCAARWRSPKIASEFGGGIGGNVARVDGLHQTVVAITQQSRAEIIDAVTALGFRGYVVTLIFLSLLTLPRTTGTGALAAVF